jgi:hypothetical protein
VQDATALIDVPKLFIDAPFVTEAVRRRAAIAIAQKDNSSFGVFLSNLSLELFHHAPWIKISDITEDLGIRLDVRGKITPALSRPFPAKEKDLVRFFPPPEAV